MAIEKMTRSVVLDNIRRRLNANQGDARRTAAVTERLARHARNTVPERAQGEREVLIDRFCEMLKRVQGTTARVERREEVPQAVHAYLGGPAEIQLTPEVGGMDIAWQDEPDLTIRDWTPRTSLDVCVSGCVGGAAETGTVAVRSASTSPLTQHFLADRHIVIMYEHQIFGAYEELLEFLREDCPRHFTFVSGPSCTGDIEMIMEYGAHGPRNLHVLIVAESGSSKS